MIRVLWMQNAFALFIIGLIEWTLWCSNGGIGNTLHPIVSLMLMMCSFWAAAVFSASFSETRKEEQRNG